MNARTDQFDSAFLAELQATEQLRAVPQELGVGRVVGGGGVLLPCRFAGGAGGDAGYFRARPVTVNGEGVEVLGPEIEVAYPPNLRAEPADYTSVSTLTGTSGGRVEIVSSGLDGAEAGVTETWTCVPAYVFGNAASLIFAAGVGFTGVLNGDGKQVRFVDVNVDARAWVSV